MREVELKAVVDDLAGTRRLLEKAGAKLVFEGSLSDRRYDVESRELAERDEVLRVRRYQAPGSSKTYLDWKGPTEIQDVYKIREEVSTLVEDFDSLEQSAWRAGTTRWKSSKRTIRTPSFHHSRTQRSCSRRF